MALRQYLQQNIDPDIYSFNPNQNFQPYHSNLPQKQKKNLTKKEYKYKYIYEVHNKLYPNIVFISHSVQNSEQYINNLFQTANTTQKEYVKRSLQVLHDEGFDDYTCKTFKFNSISQFIMSLDKSQFYVKQKEKVEYNEDFLKVVQKHLDEAKSKYEIVLNDRYAQRDIKQYRQDNRKKLLKMYREYYESNKQYLLNQRQKWYLNNKQSKLQYSKKYHQINREQILAKQKDYREKNSEKLKETYKKYNEKNREKRIEYLKEYREKNQDKLKAQKKVYLDDNKEILKQKKKDWYEQNKEEINERRRQRYAEQKLLKQQQQKQQKESSSQ